ncbi:hypothetical protein F5Y15DRAFT_41109 [Xylariaceae sp. FL0016]|nr:hypothetical protein F5Y15DRAFT_41109 [Xylariaceae sp. FL0016]
MQSIVAQLRGRREVSSGKMPPFSQKRRSEDIRRWRRSLKMADTPPLHIRGVVDDDESDENLTPDGDKSELRFNLEAKRDGNGSDDDSDHHGDRDGNGSEFESKSGDHSSSGSDSDSDDGRSGKSDDGGDSESEDESDADSSLLLPTTTTTTKPTLATTTLAVGTPAATTTAVTSLAFTTPSIVSTFSTPETTAMITSPINTLTPIAEPTISLTSSISLLTTTPLDQLGQPQKGVADPTSSSMITAFPAIQTSDSVVSGLPFGVPFTTVVPERDGSFERDGDYDDDDDHHDRKDKPPPGGLDPTAEHLLIAAGAIGAFILFCFVGWVIYRTLKKRNPGRVNYGFSDRFPWRRNGANGGMYIPNEPPPMYDKGEFGAMSMDGYYGPGKMYPPGPGSVARSNTGSIARSYRSGSQRGTMRQAMDDEVPLANIMESYPQSNDGTLRRYPQGDEGTLERYPIENGGTLGSSEPTMRSRMPDPYYNQSELARQPSDAYDPGQRQVYRASQLSSISSGFGDGDIVVPQPLAVAKPEPAIASNNAAGRFSWMSRPDERRETVYTTTSEDRPARFRSVTSWVNQQTGRVKRANSRAQERHEVPVIPAIPGQVSTTQQTAYK